MGCCKINKKKFLLSHYDQGVFQRSEWDDPGVISTWYVVYRVVLAGLMLAGVVAHALSTKDTLGAKWLIYMTNQGISCLVIHYLLYALIVLWSKIFPKPSNGITLPFIYKLSWALQNLASTTALFISLIYWTFLHPYVVEHNLMPTTWLQFLNVFLHGLNTVSYLIDIWIDARPTRIHHFYFSVIFGIYYMCFSLTYWAAGGTGRCAVRCLTPDNITISPTLSPPASTTPPPPVTSLACPAFGKPYSYPCDVVVCDDYIYPITDWTCFPGQAVLLVALAAVIGIPLLQIFWWGLHKIRTKLSLRWGGRRFEADRTSALSAEGMGLKGDKIEVATVHESVTVKPTYEAYKA